MADCLERTLKHLAANGVDLAKTPLTLGPMLKIDSQERDGARQPRGLRAVDPRVSRPVRRAQGGRGVVALQAGGARRVPPSFALHPTIARMAWAAISTLIVPAWIRSTIRSIRPAPLVELLDLLVVVRRARMGTVPYGTFRLAVPWAVLVLMILPMIWMPKT